MIVDPVAEAVAQAQSGRGRYAGIVTRGFAFGIDAIVITVGWALTIFVMAAAANVLGVDLTTTSRFLEGFAVAFSGLGSIVIYNSVMLSVFGKTFGMMTMGLRVVVSSGKSPGFFRAAIRTMAYAISMVFMLGFIWIAIDNRRQGWHDKVAKTFVVYDWDARQGSFEFLRTSAPLVPHE